MQERPLCIQGYYIYQKVWTAAVYMYGPCFLLLSVVAFGDDLGRPSLAKSKSNSK